MTEPTIRRLPLKIYDCFSSRRFGGNVGGIVLEAGLLADAEMQAIAREINAPVTGFVTALDPDTLEVRFFMPTAEIAMCGHVTVGLFAYLHEQGLAGPGGTKPPVMKARAGDVRVSTRPCSEDGVIVMMDLAPPVIERSDVSRSAVAQALGISEAAICPDLPLEIGSTGLRHLFVPIVDLATMKSMAPDFAAVTALSNELSVSTVFPFSLETEDRANTLHCRDFCPAVGVNEVPASGTTNSALAGYLVRNGLVGQADTGAPITVLAEQGAEIGRPSIIRSEIELKNGVIEAVRVGGNATLVIDGFVNT